MDTTPEINKGNPERNLSSAYFSFLQPEAISSSEITVVRSIDEITLKLFEKAVRALPNSSYYPAAHTNCYFHVADFFDVYRRLISWTSFRFQPAEAFPETTPKRTFPAEFHLSSRIVCAREELNGLKFENLRQLGFEDITSAKAASLIRHLRLNLGDYWITIYAPPKQQPSSWVLALQDNTFFHLARLYRHTAERNKAGIKLFVENKIDSCRRELKRPECYEIRTHQEVYSYGDDYYLCKPRRPVNRTVIKEFYALMQSCHLAAVAFNEDALAHLKYDGSEAHIGFVGLTGNSPSGWQITEKMKSLIDVDNGSDNGSEKGKESV